LTLSWLMEELLCEVNGQIEAFSAQVGMRIMHAVMEYEVGKIVGEWGRQSAYRHGATENSTVAKSLLEDLMERGLDPDRPMLFVIDGSKALRKAIREVFGASAPVQRCRVHKQRNIVEHLPKNKQQQAIWRLRTAWDKSNPREAEAELREIVGWLEDISPSAARSLEEALQETRSPCKGEG
jgi:transposase-like protein